MSRKIKVKAKLKKIKVQAKKSKDNDGYWHIDDGETYPRIFFCPYCGVEL